jgi:hypothetical protein
VKTPLSGATGWGRLTLVVALTALLSGCATSKIDWNARVGNYTFDQAVLELGPPDKQAKLTDGTVVAEWLTRLGYRQVYAAGGYYGGWAPGCYGPFYPGYIDAYYPSCFLRLTFSPEGRLLSWKKFWM